MISLNIGSATASECRYAAIEQDEETLQWMDVGSENSDESTNNHRDMVYEKMTSLDSDPGQDTSSTVALGDLEHDVSFWPKSKRYVRWRSFYVCRSRWNGRFSKRETLLIVFSLVLVIVTSVLISVIVNQETNQACTSRECVRAASKLESSLDESVDPCADFYEFSCGGWKRNNPLPSGYAHWGAFNLQANSIHADLKDILEKEVEDNSKDSSERKVKAFYNLCLNLTAINERGAEPLKRLIAEVGGSSIFGSWDGTNFDLTGLVTRAYSLGVPFFMGFGVSTDLKNVKKNIMQVGGGGLSLGSRKYYVNKTLDDKILKAFHVFMTEVCVLLGGDYNESSEAMKDVLLFEQQLAYISMPIERARMNNINYRLINISYLQEIAPAISWMDFINSTFKDIIPKETIKESEPITTTSIDFVKKVSDIIHSTPNNTLNNYIVWRLIVQYKDALGQSFLDSSAKIHKVLYGSDLGCIERWRSCVTDADSTFDEALGRLFVLNNFNSKSKIQAEDMVTEIKNSFKNTLETLTWMDADTKIEAFRKVNAMEDMIGFPENVLNKTYVDEEFKDFEFENTDGFFEFLLKVSKFAVKEGLKILREPVNKKEWSMTPSTINAYYSPTKNVIVFPAGILQPPAYSSDYPQSFNFGGIGHIVGHELTHGFDDQGRQYDHTGYMVNWWKDATSAEFKKKAKCIVDQYSNYSTVGGKVNGNSTVGENIADNGGVHLAYQAYMNWRETTNGKKSDPLLPSIQYSHKQLFFISFAQLWCSVSTPEYEENALITDVHSPQRIRVLGALSNSKEFAEAFNCPAGSRMNPVKKCSVW